MLSVLDKELGYKKEKLKYKKVVGAGGGGGGGGGGGRLIDGGSLTTFFPWKGREGGLIRGRGLFERVDLILDLQYYSISTLLAIEPPVAQWLERPN